jgi:hypothetical protein
LQVNFGKRFPRLVCVLSGDVHLTVIIRRESNSFFKGRNKKGKVMAQKHQKAR